eukprot:m.70692 g.70692  ORF g.70692 m.70692 type:complete len:231 (+) comp14087_c1_seq1:482-1174(+)
MRAVCLWLCDCMHEWLWIARNVAVVMPGRTRQKFLSQAALTNPFADQFSGVDCLLYAFPLGDASRCHLKVFVIDDCSAAVPEHVDGVCVVQPFDANCEEAKFAITTMQALKANADLKQASLLADWFNTKSQNDAVRILQRGGRCATSAPEVRRVLCNVACKTGKKIPKLPEKDLVRLITTAGNSMAPVELSFDWKDGNDKALDEAMEKFVAKGVLASLGASGLHRVSLAS